MLPEGRNVKEIFIVFIIVGMLCFITGCGNVEQQNGSLVPLTPSPVATASPTTALTEEQKLTETPALTKALEPTSTEEPTPLPTQVSVSETWELVSEWNHSENVIYSVLTNGVDFVTEITDLDYTNPVIPSDVTAIGDGALWECSNLTNIVLHDKIETVSDTAFQYCENLDNITVMKNGEAHVFSEIEEAVAFLAK